MEAPEPEQPVVWREARESWSPGSQQAGGFRAESPVPCRRAEKGLQCSQVQNDEGRDPEVRRALASCCLVLHLREPVLAGVSPSALWEHGIPICLLSVSAADFKAFLLFSFSCWGSLVPTLVPYETHWKGALRLPRSDE